MSTVERAASYVGFGLTFIGVILTWMINWILGFAFTIFVLIVLIWYRKTKKKGDTYLRKVANLLDCDFINDKFGYGRVIGSFNGHEIEISVNKDYDSLKGLTGFVISNWALDSAVGALAGIKNFTSIKIKHNLDIKEPIKLNNRVYLDDNLILWLPESNSATGLPKISARNTVIKIKEILNKAEKIHKNIKI